MLSYCIRIGQPRARAARVQNEHLDLAEGRLSRQLVLKPFMFTWICVLPHSKDTRSLTTRGDPKGKGACAAELHGPSTGAALHTANLPTSIMDFRGFYSSIILMLRGGLIMSIGDFPESLSQAILVGIMVVGRLGVQTARKGAHSSQSDAANALESRFACGFPLRSLQ